MRTYTLKVYHLPRKPPLGVKRLKTHHVKAENEKEARLELLKEYVFNGFRVLKIGKPKKTSNG